MERSLAHKHFVAHDTQRPDVDFVRVAALFQKLRRAIQRCTTYRKLGCRGFQDRRQTEITDLGFELDLREIDTSQELLFLLFVHSCNFGVLGKV